MDRFKVQRSKIKILLITGYLLLATPIFAQTPNPKDVFGQITPPPAIQKFGPGAKGISSFLNNLISLIFIIATIVFIFMFIWGGFEWLTSGGEKEKVGNAQKRITSALIGLVLLAVAFAIINIIGSFTGFKFFSDTIMLNPNRH